MSTWPRRILALSAPLLALFGAHVASGQDAEAASGLNSGDVAWMLTSSAIVLMMTVPGLSLFYGGLVRGKNVLSILMQCLITAGLVSVIWVLWGYSIAFPAPGGSLGGLFGNLDKFGLQGVSWDAGVGENIPEQAFMVFQLMFAIITPALIVGSFAERMKFSAFFLFVLLWSTFIYSPLAHWVWGEGGWLAARGALDFAGGIVVHVSSGASALVAAAMIGRRRGFGREPMPPHNVPFVVVGAALLWVGWFGFNAGSALAANGIATVAFVNTNTAAGAAMLTWMFSEWVGKRKPTAVGAATGAVAGLAAVTPGAGFVEPWAAIVIGAVAGFLCYKACNWKVQIGYDDALDVVGVHGVGGTWGVLATGLFASGALSGGGLFTGSPQQLLTQALAVGVTYAFCGFGTFLILGILKSVVGLRVDEEDEETGLDLTLHAESAYSSSSPGSPIGGRPPRRERIAPPAPAPSAATSAPSAATSAPSPATSAPSPATSATSRRPPVPTTTRREPPAAVPSVASNATAMTTGSNSGSAVGQDKPFRVVIEGVEKRALTRWWRDLCTQDHTKAPQPFREIYPQVRSFEGNTLYFRGGDPADTRERLADLLDIYGAAASEVRVEGVN